jgi:HNH endonuclease
MGVRREFRKPNFQHGRAYIVPSNLVSRSLVSRLIASAWLGPIHDGMDADHIDEDKTHDCLWNIQLLTHRQNVSKSYAHRRVLKERTGMHGRVLELRELFGDRAWTF